MIISDVTAITLHLSFVLPGHAGFINSVSVSYPYRDHRFRSLSFPEADPSGAFSGRLSRISCQSCRDATTYSACGSCWDPPPILSSRLFASCLWYIARSRKHDGGDDRSRKRIIARAPAPGIGDTGEALFGMDDDNVSFGSIVTDIALREI